MNHASWMKRLAWRLWWWLRNRTDYRGTQKIAGDSVRVHGRIFKNPVAGILIGGDAEYAIVLLSQYDGKIICRWHQVEVIR